MVSSEIWIYLLLQLKVTENIFNKTIEEKLHNLKKDIPMKVQDYETPYRLNQKKSPGHVIVKAQI